MGLFYKTATPRWGLAPKLYDKYDGYGNNISLSEKCYDSWENKMHHCFIVSSSHFAITQMNKIVGNSLNEHMYMSLTSMFNTASQL